MPNNASAVLLVTVEGQGILITGDIEREAQAEIMREVKSVEVDVVKVPHHGSANLAEGFADWVGAEIALISVGQDNEYGHPAPEALRAWGASEIFRTDQEGAVSLSLSPEGLWSAVAQG